MALLHSSMSEILQHVPDMEEITEFWIVYPNKIQVPLHKDDLLYESNRNTSSALILGKRNIPPFLDVCSKRRKKKKQQE